MSNVWATMPCVQLSHNMLVNCIDNRQNQLFSEMSLRDVMELPISQFHIKRAAETVQLKGRTRLYISVILLGNYNYIQQHKSVMIS